MAHIELSLRLLDFLQLMCGPFSGKEKPQADKFIKESDFGHRKDPSIGRASRSMCLGPCET